MLEDLGVKIRQIGGGPIAYYRSPDPKTAREETKITTVDSISIYMQISLGDLKA